MSKLMIALVLSLASLSSFAQTSPCAKKQILAARKALAQDVGVSVSQVSFVEFKFGMWTEAVANNVGSDDVTVAYAREGADYLIETYNVGAKQIGASRDCKVLKVRSF